MGAAQVRFVPTLAGQNHQRGGSQSLERMFRVSSMNGPQYLELSVSITGIHSKASRADPLVSVAGGVEPVIVEHIDLRRRQARQYAYLVEYLLNSLKPLICHPRDILNEKAPLTVANSMCSYSH